MANKINKIRVLLKNVRLSFANIFEPNCFNGSDPKYSANFLIEKEDIKNLSNIRDAIQNIISIEWGNDSPIINENQLCLRNGDEKKWEGYLGHFFVSSSNKLKVAVRDLDGTDLTKKNEENTPGDKPKNGDYVNAIIEIWAQNNKYGKRLNAILVGVQYIKKGERFGKISENKNLTNEKKEIRSNSPFKKLSFGNKLVKVEDEIDNLFDK